MIEIIIAILGSGVLSTLITNIFASRKENKNKDIAVKKALVALLYDRLKHLCKKYIQAGYVTFEDYEDLISLHKIYHDDLGGNGYLDSLMKQVSTLEIKGHKPI